MPAHSRAAANKAKDRRRSLIVGFAFLFVICSGGLLALVIHSPTAEPTPVPATTVRPDLDFRTAKIMNDAGNGCSQKIIDNQTWHVNESRQPCDPVLRDSNGVPVPVGTIHRLDAINKSFMGK